jgi:hypothetical protein
MRMPVFYYFLVCGPALFGVLLLASNHMEPRPMAVSQTRGVPTFKAPQESSASEAGAKSIAPALTIKATDVPPKSNKAGSSS